MNKVLRTTLEKLHVALGMTRLTLLGPR